MTEFRQRREAFLRRIDDGVAVLPTAAPTIRGSDREIRFRPDSNFFYLTGFAEPESVAVLTPHDPAHRFTLFVRPRDPEREAWNGTRAGVNGARERWGADAAYPIAELETRLQALLAPADRIWYPLGQHAGLDLRMAQLLAGFRRSRPRAGRGPAGIEDPTGVLAAMRMIKDSSEVACLRTAAALSAKGHRAAMRAASPGAGEWELEAALEFAFRSAGATGSAYSPIVGSGANATVLHYTDNNRRTEPGDLVLIDAGAEHRMYCADITRTWPVGGKFSSEQRAAYDVVHAAQEAATTCVRPGVAISDIHDAAVRVLADGMRSLGLLAGSLDEILETGAYKRFYLHQTSHWLGLDVHDAGAYREGDEPTRLAPGMVLTIEPGLYIPDAPDVPAGLGGMGIRIEDDVLVTEAGSELLTRGVPVDPVQLENLVGASLFV